MFGVGLHTRHFQDTAAESEPDQHILNLFKEDSLHPHTKISRSFRQLFRNCFAIVSQYFYMWYLFWHLFRNCLAIVLRCCNCLHNCLAIVLRMSQLLNNCLAIVLRMSQLLNNCLAIVWRGVAIVKQLFGNCFEGVAIVYTIVWQLF